MRLPHMVILVLIVIKRIIQLIEKSQENETEEAYGNRGFR